VSVRSLTKGKPTCSSARSVGNGITSGVSASLDQNKMHREWNSLA
jgi:hypothetical protein